MSLELVAVCAAGVTFAAVFLTIWQLGQPYIWYGW